MEQSTARRRNRGPVIATLIVLVLIVCAGVAVGGYFLARSQGWLPGAEEEKTEFLRMLAFVPDKAGYRDEIWFGDRDRLMAAHDMSRLRSPDDYKALSKEQSDNWMRLTRNVWTSDFSGRERVLSGWRDLFGYDSFQVDREITAGQPPEWFGVMEGAFDADDIQDALDDLGYQEDEYEGTVYYYIRDDFERDLKSEGGRFAMSKLNRVVVGEDTIIAAPATEILERVLDVRDGRRSSLADDPAYAALARAMGPVVSAALLEGEQFYDPAAALGSHATAEQREAMREKLAELYSEPLHLYDLVGFGYLDDGHDQAIVVALAYDEAEYAEADAPVLADRLEDVSSLRWRGQMLSDYWRVGEPEVYSFEDGAVLAVKLELDDEERPGLWLNMLISRDVVFLAASE